MRRVLSHPASCHLGSTKISRLISHTLHLLGEAALGLVGVAALAACVLSWRLAQGPIDVTALVQREHALFSAKGAHLTVGHAALAWEGFAASGRPLDVIAENVAAGTDDGSLRLDIRSARVFLSVPQLLRGRIAPRSVTVDGADILVQRGPGGSLHVGPTNTANGGITPGGLPRWLAELQSVQVHGARLALRGAVPGADLVARRADIGLSRLGDGGIAGAARLDLVAGGASATLDVQAALQDGGTRIMATATPVSPASLASLAPSLAGLAALDAPLGLTLQATLGPALDLRAARLDAVAGAGTLHAGRGSVGLASLAATLSAGPATLRLESLRLALAPPAAHQPPQATTHQPPPVITATASATRADARLHASFALAIDGLALADLQQYWPEGTGGGARQWLLANVPAGQAHDAHLSGSLDAAEDLSGLQLTALHGGMAADDVTVIWLRPIPGLTHGRARLVVDSPDALTITMDRGGQNNLLLTPGSSIHITGLSAKDQFGDIDMGLSGALPDALALLNHPRLHLLDRGGFQATGAKGSVTAHMTLHVPLDDRVTMDQIAIAATASLADVHLGRIAAGRDLDGGQIKLKVTGDGLQATGTGAVATIPAQLGLDMDFRNGKPAQVVQHVTAAGDATPAQLSHAGLPAAAVQVLTGGQVGLHVDYAARRSGSAALQLDADLTRAGLRTPLGWSKPAGPPAAASGRVLLDHGRLAGIDALHASGPGLLIVSRAQVTPISRALLLDRLEIGRTRAHGRLDFPTKSGAPLRVTLSGPLLDLSAQLDPPKRPAATTTSKAGPAKDATDDKPGLAWAVQLAFDQVQLAKGKRLAGLAVDAASDGTRILHAHAHAGAPGELALDITPQPGGRRLAVSAADAGAMLRALGVADNLAGGRLQVDARSDDTKPNTPLAGTVTLTEFNLRSAPAIGRLLQAMTVYGLTDVLRGPGLHFSNLVAPFVWHDRVLSLSAARAFSASLGITARGDLDLRRRIADITGTVVPAYFFNQLLGDLPLIGRLFSPEKGGGVFAARFSVRGPLDDPKVGVNPLSALTPGFLREGFGLLSGPGRK